MFFDKPKKRSISLGVIEAPKPKEAEKKKSGLNILTFDSADTFKAQLRQWIKSPPPGSIRVIMTPAMADVMLTYNIQNRAIKRSALNRLTRDIHKGQWIWNGQPIIFSDRPRMVEGQHRCTVCLQTGISLDTSLLFGVSDAAFVTYGEPGRSVADVYSIDRLPNYVSAASTVRVLLALQSGDRTGHSGVGPDVYSAEDKLNAYKSWMPFIEEAVLMTRRFHKARLPHASAAGAVYFIAHQQNPELADEFFKKIASGVGLTSERHPAYKVREYLKVKQDRYRAPVINVLIQGWNSVYTKKPMKMAPDVRTEFVK